MKNTISSKGRELRKFLKVKKRLNKAICLIKSHEKITVLSHYRSDSDELTVYATITGELHGAYFSVLIMAQSQSYLKIEIRQSITDCVEEVRLLLIDYEDILIID